jgi:ABC-type glycerol-3-phosphate transport system substrate-binding protein
VKRLLAAAVIVLGCAACGGGGASSAPTPAPTLAQNPKTGILKPAANARDTVNQLNQQQNNYEQQTGSGNP